MLRWSGNIIRRVARVQAYSLQNVCGFVCFKVFHNLIRIPQCSSTVRRPTGPPILQSRVTYQNRTRVRLSTDPRPYHGSVPEITLRYGIRKGVLPPSVLLADPFVDPWILWNRKRNRGPLPIISHLGQWWLTKENNYAKSEDTLRHTVSMVFSASASTTRWQAPAGSCLKTSTASWWVFPVSSIPFT